ncbi:MAG TPA: hypothetical protein VHU15_15325, partial [Stellaceae bacterium]|nr:hypothetical protein [Stellaceae bacterium]
LTRKSIHQACMALLGSRWHGGRMLWLIIGAIWFYFAVRALAFVVALPWRTWPIAHPSLPGKKVHRQTLRSN